MLKKILLILTAAIVVIGVFGYGYIDSLFKPVDPNSEEIVQIQIPKGSTSTDIANILEENNLIKNELIFRLYLKYSESDGALKAGEYSLSSNMDIKGIVQVLINGNTKIDSVRFTIPEGYNVKQIAKKLADEGLVDEERFLELAKEGNFNYDFVKEIPDKEDVEYKLEGYLFPETYEIRRGATEEEIIDKMLSQFNKEWKPEWNELIKEKGYTIYDIVTLASIVEREVVVDKERPIVAGVFYNRLNDSWSLQSCATVQFVLGKQKDTLTFDDLEIKSPYNTYVNQGLPPGPIGSPGRSSLQATVSPAEHEYYFFVTKKDNSGEHYFSKTFSEHQQYDAKSRGNW